MRFIYNQYPGNIKDKRFFILVFFILTFLFSCKKHTVEDSIQHPDTSDTIEGFLRTETTGSGYRAVAYNKNYSLKWQKDLSGEYFQKPVLYKGMLYFSSGYSLTVINAGDGVEKWSIDNSFGYFANLSFRNDTIFYNHFNTNFAFIEASNALTGEVYWQVPFQDVYDYGWGSFIEGNTFYFISADRNIKSHVNAFDIAAKHIIWQSPISYSHGPLFSCNNNSFGIIDHIDHLGNEGDLYLINKTSGQFQWNKTRVNPRLPNFYDNLVICNPVRFSLADPGLIAFDSENGDIRWSRFEYVYIVANVISGNNIYIAGLNASDGESLLFCADLVTGNIIWTRKMDPMYNKLIVFDNVIYANIEPFATIPPNASGTVSFDSKTGAMIDSAKIGPNIMILTSSGRLIK